MDMFHGIVGWWFWGDRAEWSDGEAGDKPGVGKFHAPCLTSPTAVDNRKLLVQL